MMKLSKIYQKNILLLVFLLMLEGCAQATPATPGAVYRQETVVLPTGAPAQKPTPLNTRVISAEVLTPQPTPTITPLPAEVRGLVVEALDGDTIRVVLEGDPPGRAYTVRYLGIDAPPNTPSIPWGRVAFEINRKLTSGKVVRLERDQSDADDDGNLLRYVYLGDDLLSITLAEQGLARANSVEPDTAFQTEISEAEQQARAGQIGLWSNRPPTPTPRPTNITNTTTITVTVTPPSTTEAETEPTTTAEATSEETASPASPTSEVEISPTTEPDDEPSDTTPTTEPTLESTPNSDTEGEDLQGP